MVLKTLELQKLSEGSSLKAKDFRQTLGFT